MRREASVITVVVCGLWAVGVAAAADTYQVADWSELVAANTAAADGDTIALAAGTYTQAAAFAVSKSLTFIGDPAGGTLIALDNTNSFYATGQAGGSVQSWSNVTFDRQGYDDQRAFTATATSGNLTISFTDCVFANSGNLNGLNMTTENSQSHNLSVTALRCTAYGNGNDGFNLSQGTSATGTAVATLVDCVSYDNDNDGASPHSNCTMHVSGGRYVNNGKNGLVNTGTSSILTATGVYLEHDATPTTSLVVADNGATVTLTRCALVGDSNTTTGLVATSGNGATLTAYDCTLTTAGGNDARCVYASGASTLTLWDCTLTTGSTYGTAAGRGPVYVASTATGNLYRCIIDHYAATGGSTGSICYATGGTLNVEGCAIICGLIEGDGPTNTHYAAHYAAGSAGSFVHNTVTFRETTQRPCGLYLVADNIVCRGNLIIGPYWGFRAGTANYYDGVAGSGYNVVLGSLNAAVYNDTPIVTDVTAGTAPTFIDSATPHFDLRLKTRGVAAKLDPNDAYLISYDGYSTKYTTYDREPGAVGSELDAGAYTVAVGNGLSLWGGAAAHRATGTIAGSAGLHAGPHGGRTGTAVVHAGAGAVTARYGVHAR